MNTVIVSGHLLDNPRVHGTSEHPNELFLSFEIILDDEALQPCLPVCYTTDEDDAALKYLTKDVHVIVEGALDSYRFRVHERETRHLRVYIKASKVWGFTLDNLMFDDNEMIPIVQRKTPIGLSQPPRNISPEPVNCKHCGKSMLRIYRNLKWYHTCCACDLIFDTDLQKVEMSWNKLVYGRGEFYTD